MIKIFTIIFLNFSLLFLTALFMANADYGGDSKLPITSNSDVSDIVFVHSVAITMPTSPPLPPHPSEGYLLTTGLWGETIIPVCWENPTPVNSLEREWTRSAISRTWESASRLKFIGWEVCPAGYFQGIRIQINDVGPHVKNLGKYLSNVTNGMVLNFTFVNWSPVCSQNGDSYRRYCIEAIAVHEFGHAIGFAHEQNRPDTPLWCQDQLQGGNGDWLVTPWDIYSTMNYCNPSWNNNGNLSEYDIETVWKSYGDSLSGLNSTGKLAALSRITTTYELFSIESDGSIRANHWHVGMIEELNYQIAPPGSASTTGKIVAVSRAPNTMDIWWIGSDGSVQGAFWTSGSSTWNRYILAPQGNASTNGGLAVASRAQNTMEVWWIGSDGSIQGAYWYDGMVKWGRYQLAPANSASVSGDIIGGSRQNNTLEVWWIAPDGSIWDAYWYLGFTQWRKFSLSGPNSAHPSGNLTAVSRSGNTLEIFWISPDGAIWDAYWYVGFSSWQKFQFAPQGSSIPLGSVIATKNATDSSMGVFWGNQADQLRGAKWTNVKWQACNFPRIQQNSSSTGFAHILWKANSGLSTLFYKSTTGQIYAAPECR